MTTPNISVQINPVGLDGITPLTTRRRRTWTLAREPGHHCVCFCLSIGKFIAQKGYRPARGSALAQYQGGIAATFENMDIASGIGLLATAVSP
jgi:hypothetical protein